MAIELEKHHLGNKPHHSHSVTLDRPLDTFLVHNDPSVGVDSTLGGDILPREVRCGGSRNCPWCLSISSKV